MKITTIQKSLVECDFCKGVYEFDGKMTQKRLREENWFVHIDKKVGETNIFCPRCMKKGNWF